MQNHVSGATLATRFGVSKSAITQLEQRGVIKREQDGKFDIHAATLVYCQHLREVASGRAGAEETASAKRKSLEASAALKRQQELSLKQRLEVERGNLIARAELVKLVGGSWAFFKAQLLALIPLIAGRFSFTAVQREELRKIIYETLEAIAKKQPEDIFPHLGDGDKAA